MKFGIYYAYWAKDWGGDFLPYVGLVESLGFDVLEVACGDLINMSDAKCLELKSAAEDKGIVLTGGYGPRPEHDISSPDSSIIKNAFDFYEKTFSKMKLAGIKSLGGALYSYWPVNCPYLRDKDADMERSILSMQMLADMAAEYEISLNMEALNRFEGYMINCADECISYVNAVNRPNVKVMLDTFHMNIEEDSFTDSINRAGKLLGHFHVGEANRRPPYPNGRIPWIEIGSALRNINYDGAVVMEPFVRTGGQVGRDISIWRDISKGKTDDMLSRDAAESVAFIRKCFSEV